MFGLVIKMPAETSISHLRVFEFKSQRHSLLQLLVNVQVMLSSWVPLPMWETWTEVLAPWPGPAVVVASTWGVNQQVGILSLK